MNMNYCYSCSAPLNQPGFKGAAEHYCAYCTDAAGKLKPRAEVQQGVAQWFMSWQPGLDPAKASARAALFMRAMPAWAED